MEALILKRQRLSKRQNYVPLLLPFLFVPTVSIASTLGVGEYRFGPETTENSACEFASEEARKNAIAQFVGERINSLVVQECNNEECETQQQTINETSGVIQKIINTQKYVTQENGYRVCTVTIEAIVKEEKNIAIFEAFVKESFYDGENVSFYFTSTKPGSVFIFNFTDGFYNQIDNGKITPNDELRLPQRYFRIVARLPKDKFQDKELMAFVFVESEKDVKKKYTAKEMKSFVSSGKNRVVYKYLTIKRKT